MNIKQSTIELLQESREDHFIEIDEDALAEEGPKAIEISLKDSPKSQNQYPSMNSKSYKTSQYDLWSSSRNSEDDIDNIRVPGIKKSSVNFEESSFNQNESFADLNYSANEEYLKSKLQQKLKSIREENRISPSEQEMKKFNMSIFTEKVMEESPKKKKSSESQEDREEVPINYEQSFYLTKPEEKTKKKSHQRYSQEQKKIRVTFTSKNYFLQINQYSVEIDKASLQDMYSQLFKKEIFVPLFNYQRYYDWAKIKDFSKYSLECQTHMNFKVYLERYVEYLNKIDPNILEEVIKNVQFIQQGKNEKRMPEQSSLSFLNLNNLIEQFKALLTSSKTESLRKTLLSKLRSITSLLKESQKWSITQAQMEIINKVKETIWRELSSVELLLSFESTDQYCSKKIQNSQEMKFKEIYIRYRDVIRKEKSRVIAQIDSVHL